MRSFTLFILLLLLCSSLNAALPDQLTRSGNPELYLEINTLARENLENLPRYQQREYGKLLSSQDDILMSFLIAYEEDAKLAEADPATILSNYSEILALLEIQPLQYSPEFFLSYIAKQSVSDERITPYRREMLDAGLADVITIEDPLQRYRAAASWCVEKLKFEQTSGRDLSPVDIVHRSLAGRCEEMQILFVAAARTVGLASRPASTPYWAHMDNNHAWAEIWLDDGWQYTGDMDAAYFPNQTWFSGMVDKTVLILAQGSLAADEDDVLISGRYDAVINSTPNYAAERTRNIEIRSIDQTGEAIPEVKVAVMVYNWGALRPIIVLKTDENGRLSFSAGSGDFFLSAYKDGKHALLPINASESSDISAELELASDNSLELDLMLSYPANESARGEAPQSYRDDISHRKELWEATMQSWREEVTASGIADSLEIALNTRGNFAEYRRFYLKHQPVDQGFLEFLGSYDPKFLWQADADLFEALYRFWQAHDPDSPRQLFYPTVFYEELPRAWASRRGAKLYPDDFVLVGKSPRDRMKKVLNRMQKLYEIDARKALSGLLRMDIAAKMKYLTDYQYRILAISMLRANGIPADFTRLPDNILVYLDDEWHYYDLKAGAFSGQGSEDARLAELTLYIEDQDGMPLDISPDRLTLNRFIDGIFYTINAPFSKKQAGVFSADLPEGELFLHFGYRINDSRTALQVHQILDDTPSLKLIARDYPRAWEDADEELLLVIDPQLLQDKDLIILGNHDHENSLRILDHFLALDTELDYAFIGHTRIGSRRLENYIFSPAWQTLVNEGYLPALPGITLYKSADGWKSYIGRWESLPLN